MGRIGHTDTRVSLPPNAGLADCLTFLMTRHVEVRGSAHRDSDLHDQKGQPQT